MLKVSELSLTIFAEGICEVVEVVAAAAAAAAAVAAV